MDLKSNTEDKSMVSKTIQAQAQAQTQAQPQLDDDDRMIYKQSVAGFFQSFVDDIAQAKEPISTGFSELDRVLDNGLGEGRLYVIGGKPGNGKSALALQIADFIAESGKDVLYFSLEMTKGTLAARGISRQTARIAGVKSGISAGGIMAGYKYNEMGAEEYQLIQKAMSAYYEAEKDTMHIVDGFVSAQTIRETADKYFSKGRKPVVFCDYLQAIRRRDPDLSDKQAVDESIEMLMRLRDTYKVPVVVLSSLNRKSYDEGGLTGFKSSGDIEFNADAAMIISKDGDTAEIEIIKNRQGESDKKIELNYYARVNLMTDKVSKGLAWDDEIEDDGYINPRKERKKRAKK